METKYCNKCNKELSISNFRRVSSKWKYFSRCKECERTYRRRVDYERYHNNIKRKTYINRKANQRVKSEKRWALYRRVQRLAIKWGYYDNPCPICNAKWNIVAHHPDYSKRNEVVFCCKQCHMAIHRWEIKNFDVINLLGSWLWKIYIT